MNYPLRLADQLTAHLRALRKLRGLTQAQLGARVGIRQARVAEIEANPGVVSLDQVIQLLAALDATLHLTDRDPLPAAPAATVHLSEAPPDPGDSPADPGAPRLGPVATPPAVGGGRRKKGSW